MFPNMTKSVIEELRRGMKGFVYLGAHAGSAAAAVKARVGKAWGAYHALQQKLWRHRRISTATKCRIWQCVVLPVLMYGLAALPVSAAAAKPLDSFAYRCARRLLGVFGSTPLSYVDVVSRFAAMGRVWQWPSRLLADQQMRNFGHFARHYPDVAAWDPEGAKRPRGRPVTRMHDVVRHHLGWTSKEAPRDILLLFAQDRTEWSGLAGMIDDSF